MHRPTGRCSDTIRAPSRFSPLKQINAGNVDRLQRAWTFHTGKPGSEGIPIVVGGVMYVTAANGILRGGAGDGQADLALRGRRRLPCAGWRTGRATR